MKKLLSILLCVLLIICTGFVSKDTVKDDENKVTLSKINENVWIHTTYGDFEGVSTPANGLVVLSSKGAILIDTPWSNDETEALIKLVKKNFKKNIVLAIITHAHVDRIGGIDTLLKHGITVESTELTAKAAVKNGYKSPKPVLKKESVLKVGNLKIVTYYPGEGHTKDNIVVWLSDYKILFGGCLIKSQSSDNLGYINDANVKEWPKTIERLIKKYPDAKVVVPGHGECGGLELLTHTLQLSSK